MSDRDMGFSDLMRAASPLPAPGADFEHRVMVEVARRAIARSRRRERRGLVASLTGLAMLLAGCVAALVVWYPTLAPAFIRSFSWVERLSGSLRGIFERMVSEGAAGGMTGSGGVVSLLEQWGGPVLIGLLVCGAVGAIYYLNSLFSNDYTAD